MISAPSVDSGLIELCLSLHEIAQRHTPASCFADVNELVQITKLLQELSVPVQPATKHAAAIADHSSAVVRHSPEYRLMRARFTAALGTIADMGSRKIRKNKDQFHAGIQEGLRRAAKVAIMFLEDLDANVYRQHTPDAGDNENETISPKSRSSIVR